MQKKILYLTPNYSSFEWTFSFLHYLSSYGSIFPINYREYNKETLHNILKDITKFVDFELCIVIKGESIDPSVIDCYKVIYAIDDSLAPSKTVELYKAYDIIFTPSQKMLKEYGSKGRFLSYFYDDLLYTPLRLPKDIDVSCISTAYKERVRFIQELLSISKIRTYGSGWEDWNWEAYRCDTGEAVIIHNRSKINLNIIPNHHLDKGIIANMKLFEVLGCCGFLLTNKTDNLEKYFKNNKEIMIYNSLKECKELIKYYLDSPREREEIARRGYEKVQDYKLSKRVKTILEESGLI